MYKIILIVLTFIIGILNLLYCLKSYKNRCFSSACVCACVMGICFCSVLMSLITLIGG